MLRPRPVQHEYRYTTGPDREEEEIDAGTEIRKPLCILWEGSFEWELSYGIFLNPLLLPLSVFIDRFKKHNNYYLCLQCMSCVALLWRDNFNEEGNKTTATDTQ